MTGNEILSLAKKRVKSTNTQVEWAKFYAMVIDEIFSERQWKFARQTLYYIHGASTFEKIFNETTIEKSLSGIINVVMTSNFAIVGGVPIPVSNTGRDLVYYPYQDFLHDFPVQTEDGDPLYFTIINTNDGLNGMQIGIYPRPVQESAVWVHGDFIPAYVISDDEMPILPKQFHRMVVDGVIRYAAEELDLPKISRPAESRFLIALEKLKKWDNRNHAYFPIRKPYAQISRKGPAFPTNYPNVR